MGLVEVGGGGRDTALYKDNKPSTKPRWHIVNYGCMRIMSTMKPLCRKWSIW